MSREVDQRVVELQFNNANFEKNTKKSMDSIDRMMEKLQFKGAEKGFEKLEELAALLGGGSSGRWCFAWCDCIIHPGV